MKRRGEIFPWNLDLFPFFSSEKNERKKGRRGGEGGQGRTGSREGRVETGCLQEEEEEEEKGGWRNADNEREVSRACSDSDVSANDGTDAVHGGALINSPVDVLSEDLGLEAGKVDGPVAKDVSDSRDTRYTATVRRQPVDGRCRISSHYAVHSAPVHVREFHPRRWLRHEAWPLHLVRRVATCNKPVTRCILPASPPPLVSFLSQWNGPRYEFFFFSPSTRNALHVRSRFHLILRNKNISVISYAVGN